MFQALTVRIEARNVEGKLNYFYGLHGFNDQVTEASPEMSLSGEHTDVGQFLEALAASFEAVNEALKLDVLLNEAVPALDIPAD